MNDITLTTLNSQRKLMVAVFTVVLTIGVLIGLGYIMTNTGASTEGLSEHYRGSALIEDFEVPEKYPKGFSSMLLNTHSHLLSFAVIFVIIGFIFSFNTTIRGRWKTFYMVEPLMATLVTFGSLWGLRYISPVFLWLVILSGILMYTSYFIMAGVIFYETALKK